MPDDIGISASLTGDIGAAIETVEHQVEDLGDAGARMGTKMRVAGKEAAEGMDEVRRATGRARDENGRFLPSSEKATDSLQGQGRAAAVTGSLLDRYSRKAKKAARAAGGLGAALMAVKFAVILSGGFAVLGMLSALGAAAIMAVGGLAPMIGIFAAFGPLAFMGASGILAFKLAGDAVSETFKPLAEDFKSYGDAIRGVMLPGMRTMVTLMRGQLVPVLAGGLINVADIIGYIADEFGHWATSAHTLNRLGSILQAMSPVMRPIATGLMMILSALLSITDGAMPMVAMMADDFRHVAEGLALWTEQMRESGRMTAWLNKSWALTKRVVGVLVDVMIGLYNIFRIAGGQAVEMGLSVETLAGKFRQWSASAQGQARITQYFQDAIPAIREMGLLLGALIGGLGSLAASQNVAPLIAQMRTELLPALGLVVEKVAGAEGIGPALITALSQIATAVAQIPSGPMVQLIVALGGLVAGIAWLLINVPGLATVVGYLSAALLGWKVALTVATFAGGALTTLVSLFKALYTVANVAGKILFFAGKAILFVGRAIAMAMMANPVIAAIMIIIGIILYLWFNCEWFRDAVIAAWEWIANAAVVAWNWIVDAVGIAIGWIVDKATWLWENGIKPIWEIISTAAKIYWDAWVAIVTGAIDVIVTIAQWLWTNIIKPVWEAISAGAEMYWGIVKWIVQAVVFFIMLIVWGIAKAAEQVWETTVTAATAAWEGIMAAVDWFADRFREFGAFVAGLWNGLVDELAWRWNWFYSNVIEPVVNFFITAWTSLVGYVTTKWNELTGLLSLAWSIFYNTYIAPIIHGILEKWNYLTSAASAAWEILTQILSDKWEAFKDKVGRVIDLIKDGWEGFTSFMGDIFSPVGDLVGKIFDGIGKAAGNVADIVKGAWNGVISVLKSVWNALAGGWNSVPSVTIPDFVPVLGGKTFSLPKMPTLWHGGPTPGGPAVVGELGPEPVIRNGRLAGMVGMNGPEIANLPRGGYVVPNLDTLSRLPGLTKTLPSTVAHAVARSVPGYGDLLDTRSAVGTVVAPSVTVRNDDHGVGEALRGLATAVREQRPPLAVGSNATKADVLAALRQHDREKRVAARYEYGG